MIGNAAGSRDFERSLRAYARIAVAASVLIHASVIGLLAAIGGPDSLLTPDRPDPAVTFVSVHSVEIQSSPQASAPEPPPPPVTEPRPILPPAEPRPMPEPSMSQAATSLEPLPSVPVSGSEAPATEATASTASHVADEEYMPQFKISDAPVIPAKEVLSRIEYPVLAAQQGIEATVYLELYIDKSGRIVRATVLKDPGFGFAEAAAKALVGLVCSPARMGDEAVAVRYRYPVRFTLR